MSAAHAEAHGELLWEGKHPEHFKALDRAGEPREWDGWLMAKDSTEVPESLQWSEMEVYLTTGGYYVLRVLGMSVIYHRHGSRCNTGDPKHGRDMADDMEPCSRCHPAANYRDESNDDTLFDAEVVIPTITYARTPEELVSAMRWGNGPKTGSFSYLAARVMRKLRTKDRVIDALMRRPVVFE